MDLTQLANLGEFIGGVAVLVTLILLVIQLRQSTAAMRMAVSQDMTRSAAAFLENLSTDPRRAAIWFNGLQDMSALSREEFQVFNVTMGSLCRAAEAAAHHLRENTVDARYWSGSESALIGVMRLPGARAWWALSETLYNDALRALVRDAHGRETDPEWAVKIPAYLASLPAEDSDYGRLSSTQRGED